MFRTTAPESMKNVLKTALHYGESKIACIIVAYYELNLDQATLEKAIRSAQLEVLKYLWGFGKNFFQRGAEKPVFVSFKMLFDIVKKVCRK